MAQGLVLNEQRELIRRNLIYYLKLVDQDKLTEIGRMADIHTAGMLLLCQEEIPVGKVFVGFLELPKIMAEKRHKKYIKLTCKALWSRPGPKCNNFIEVGVRFLKLGHMEKNIINDLIELFSMPGSCG